MKEQRREQWKTMTDLLNWNLNLRLSRFRATTTIKSNGTSTTIKLASFSMVGRRSRDGRGSWGTW